MLNGPPHGGGHHHGGGGGHPWGGWGWGGWNETVYLPYDAGAFDTANIPWGWVAIGGLAGVVLALLVKR